MGTVTEVAPDALDDLKRLSDLRTDVEKMLVKAVKDARRRGVSWYKIGPALGVSRQAAMEKYKKQMPKASR
jgi:hypothetical protein